MNEERTPANDSAERRARSAAQVAAPVGAVLLMFAILVVGLSRTGVFDKDTSASDGQVIAAMLTLLGGLVASAFALIGVLLQHSIERHAAHLAEEAELNRQREAAQDQARLQQETAIKAVELLTLPDGKPAPPARQAGALFVLASTPLQQVELALALVDQNWSEDGVPSSAAVSLIDRWLQSDSEYAQEEAAQILREHARLLPEPDGHSFQWPECADLKWPALSSYYARAALERACAAMLAARSPDVWPADQIRWFMCEFDLMRRDEEPEISRAAAAVLDVLLKWHLDQHGPAAITLGADSVDVAALRAELAPIVALATQPGMSADMWGLLEELRGAWGYRARGRARVRPARARPAAV